MRSSAVPIEWIGKGGAGEPSHVYVRASDAVPMLRSGRLRLAEQRAAGRERNTIDVFFTSLAEDRGENAVAGVGCVANEGNSDARSDCGRPRSCGSTSRPA